MGLDAMVPMSLALLLLCADPMTADDQARDVSMAIQAALRPPASDVVASSPVPAGIQVGSHYGWRTSTRTGSRTFHAGVDFLTDRGTPVYSVRSGVVETVTSDSDSDRRFAGYGNAVVIHHPADGLWSFYAHLEGVFVEAGQVVEPGQVIGRVGNTTNGRFHGMIAHLHMEVRHARADGNSPFPGGYGRHNEDPEEWLDSMGVHLDLELDHETAYGEEPLLVLRDGIEDLPVLVAAADHGLATF